MRDLLQELKKDPIFIRELHNYLRREAEREATGGETDGYWHASGIGSCDRENYYNITGAPSEPTGLSGMKRMRIGEFHHGGNDPAKTGSGWLNEFVRAGSIIVMGETLKRENPRVMGRPDFYAARQETKEEILHLHKDRKEMMTVVLQSPHLWDLVEWKTRDPDLLPIYSPLVGHVLQWNIYGSLSNVHQGWIIYENKSSGDFYPLSMVYDEQLVQDTYERLRRVEEIIVAGGIPPIQCERGDSRYKYCGFKNTICWRGEK